MIWQNEVGAEALRRWNKCAKRKKSTPKPGSQLMANQLDRSNIDCLLRLGNLGESRSSSGGGVGFDDDLELDCSACKHPNK